MPSTPVFLPRSVISVRCMKRRMISRTPSAAMEATWINDQYHKERYAAGLWHNLEIVNNKIGDTAGSEQYRQKEAEMRDGFTRVLAEERRAAELPEGWWNTGYRIGPW